MKAWPLIRSIKNFSLMSTEQRKTAWDVTKMIVTLLLGISSFAIVRLYDEQVDNTRKQNELLMVMNNRMQNLEIKMVRVEYELKLK